MKKGVVFLLVCFFVFMGVTNLSYADDAEVLPKGVFNINTAAEFYFDVDERFDENGDVENIADDYNKLRVDCVFDSSLCALDLAFSAFLPTGASLGETEVSFEYEHTELDILIMYGLTDKLTIGMNIPYWWQKTNVSVNIDTSNATVGLNPNVSNPVDPFFGVPIIPLSLGGVIDDATATGIVQNALQGIEYDKVEDWSDEGLSDIEAGFKYQYFNNETWRLAFLGALRFPTGKLDDPDNLMSLEFGDGAYAFLFNFNNDYTGIENLVLNGTFRYEFILPYKETLRIPTSVGGLTPLKAEVERDIGDSFEFEVSGDYEFYKGLGVSLLYKYSFKLEDDYSEGPNGVSLKPLEDETKQTSHIYIAGLSYSTIPLFMDKKFPAPLKASISYRERFAGSDNILKTKYIGGSLGVFF